MMLSLSYRTVLPIPTHRGGLGDLNIYVIRPLSGTLGWSTFPWEAIKLGESFDGVLVHVGTMPGGLMKPYNKGFTMVHEVRASSLVCVCVCWLGVWCGAYPGGCLASYLHSSQ